MRVESEWGRSQWGFHQLVVPAKRSASRDPYAAAPRFEAVSAKHLAQQLLPVVMGPCVRRDDSVPYCVFATRGGSWTVWNCVASSTASPNGVGIARRNGTSTRVPAIGTSVISIFRSVARYLITGRSGM